MKQKLQGVQFPQLEMKEQPKPQAPTALSESSIRERALLVRFSIGRWYGSGADESVVHEVRVAKEATGEIGSFTKRLMKRDRLGEINRITTEARKYHKIMTLPWGDSGNRLLAVEMFMEYKSRMTKYEQDFNIAVDNFLKQYLVFVEDEKKNLRGLWKASDYPDVEAMRSRFRFGLAVEPLPDASDLRIKLSKEQSEEIKHEIEERMRDSLHGALSDVYERIAEQIADAKEKLDASDPKLRTAMFGGLQELLALLPRMNLLKDPKLTALGAQIQKDLLSVPVDALKDSATQRASVSSKAGALLKNIAALQKGKP